MTIEVLNTGTELMLGNTLNTHGAWLGRELFKRGWRVARQTTVPDGAVIVDALRECCGRAEVVIVTGGLGPTSDDITREATAEVLGLELIEDAAALRVIQEFFAKRGRPMAAANRKQALVPAGAEMLPNPNGTAPGVYVPPRLNERMNCAVFLLPGPPGEMRPMFEAEVVSRLRKMGCLTKPPEQLELKFAGIGESDFHQGVDDRLARVDGLEYGYCARVGEVDLRLIGPPEAVHEGRRIALESFAANLVSDDGSSLEEVVVGRLKRRGWRLATAESCTGGLIAHRITNVPGASAVFTHGFVTYANEAKVDLLGVLSEDLAAHGAVSEVVARQMAEGALRVSAADVAVAVTGIAGPDGGSAEKPVGTVFLALAVQGAATWVERQFHPRSREDFKQAVSQAALAMVAERSAFGELRAGFARPPSRSLSSRIPQSPVPPPGSPPPTLVFHPFDRDSTIDSTHGSLPHWHQAGATHFVTFRLHDSLPAAVVARWLRERKEWLALRGESPDRPGWYERLSPDDRREYSRSFGRTFEQEIDKGAGSCLLRKPANARIMADTLAFFDGRHYALGDYVIMPNHVHLLVVPAAGHRLQEIVRSWKSFSAKEINKQEDRSGQVWQHESFDHVVRHRRQLERIRNYIAENPSKAGLHEGDYWLRVAAWGEE